MSLAPTALDDRIELRELLGEGGMGEVHAAWDRSLARSVAVKLVRGTEPLAAERLLLEARLQARVEHPHVVRVFEVGSLAGRPCILFQLVRGRTLADLAAELSIADRAELVRQAATGIHAAHEEGLVHRDVKPGNVLVEEGEDGRKTALVTDFGLAHAEEGGLTRSGVLPGTLDFMAPEQLAGGGPADTRSDVYALGATLYAVLAGRPPFRIPSAKPEASGEEQVKLLRRVLDEEAPPLRSVAPDVPRELSLVARKAMEKEPPSRYASAEAFADDLARFQRGEPVRARPPALSERALKWTRRNPTASRAVGAALAVLLAAGGFTLWLSRQAGRDALEAARLGAVASSLETRMRMEYLSPPHDLRPARAAVKAEVEALRPLAARGGGGPVSFALGKGLELLGDLDGARTAYERAWSAGFRTPQVAEGLGEVLGRLYGGALEQAMGTLSGEPREARARQLRAELGDPARRYLEQGDAGGARGAFLRGRIALLEGDFAGARERAAEVLALDPGRYEALVLEGEAWSGEADRDRMKDHLDTAWSALEKAVAATESGIRSGRSDPGAHLLLARIHAARGALLVARGSDPTPALDASLGTLERAAALDPEEPEVAWYRGRALVQKTRYDAMAGRREALELSREAVRLLRGAAERSPGNPGPLRDLAIALAFQSMLVREWNGASATAEVTGGLAASEAALRLSPGDAETVRTRATLLLGEATDQLESGADPTAALDELERRCAEGEQLDPERAPALREVLLQSLELRARAEWGRGGDPRPVFERAIGAAEELRANARGRRSAISQLSAVLVWYALALLEMGEDPAPQMARALALADEDLARQPELRVLIYTRAQYAVIEAWRRATVGSDAAPVIAEARSLFARATRGARAASFGGQTLGLLALAEAHDQARRGADPGAALGRCEAAFASVAGPAERRVREEGLARCALARIRWGIRRGGAHATAAARAAAEALRVRQLDPRDPGARAVAAHLRALSGDAAGARASLDEVYAAQPLARGNPDARAAEALLAALSRTRAAPRSPRP